MSKKLTGSQMLIEALAIEGVKVIFGYPGGAVLHIYDEIYKQTYFRHILTRHEQAAVHAADGYVTRRCRSRALIRTIWPI